MTGFEWTFSTRGRERKCSSCREKTPAYLTNLSTGMRRPLCSSCFLAISAKKPSASEKPAPAFNLEIQEQLRLC
jgi:hypothetical protein